MSPAESARTPIQALMPRRAGKRSKPKINGIAYSQTAARHREEKFNVLRRHVATGRHEEPAMDGSFGEDQDNGGYAGAHEEGGPYYYAGLAGASPGVDKSDSDDADRDASTRLRDAVVQIYCVRPRRKHTSWSARKGSETTGWDSQLDFLEEAFVRLLAREAGDPDASRPDADGQLGVPLLLDIFPRAEAPIIWNSSPWPNVSLIHAGFLGCSPLKPTTAFSIRTLRFFAYCKNRTFSSRQGFVRALCDNHSILYERHLVTQFTTAFDIYCALTRRVDQRINEFLGRAGRDWWVQHSCPCCSYECEGEAQLKFGRLVTIDGNNSLKRFSFASLLGGRELDSNYFLPPEYVDRFKDEVRARPPRKPRRGRGKNPDGEASSSQSAEDSDERHAPGTLSDTDDDECVWRWRNAQPETTKTAWKAFEETGLFAAVCRHGFVLLVADMRRSGELYKYPLAIVKKLLEVIPGQLTAGYDIGCKFAQTVLKSSFEDLAKTRALQFVVGAFHGYGHDRYCQLAFHPKYVAGSGLEDFEGCERLFSHTNRIAGTTRYATPFHRHQDIDACLSAWDAEKYANLADFLLRKLKDALSKLREHAPTVADARGPPHFLDDTRIDELIAEEMSYLHLKKATRKSTARLPPTLGAYAQALTVFRLAQEAVQLLPRDPAPRPDGHAEQRARSKVERAIAKLAAAERLVEVLERKLGISTRWQTTDAEYGRAMRAVDLEQYEASVDELERQVVSRLFEIEKADMRGTGYKLRKQIATGLSKRSTTVKAAVRTYNHAATCVGRPKLNLKDVMDVATLDDFALLRETDPAILSKPWALPYVRAAVLAHMETRRAQEEILRLNVEAVRLRTWIHDEEWRLTALISKLRGSSDIEARPYAACVQRRATLLQATNTKLLGTLNMFDVLSGFPAPRTPGRARTGSIPAAHARNVPTSRDLDASEDDEQQEADLDILARALEQQHFA